MPDPDWLEHWLDKQIQFDAPWEAKVVNTILIKLSNLFGQPFESVKDLNRYRKQFSIAATNAA
jgi:hypothetical protein